MAAVKQHLARGAYDFAQKTCNRYLLKSHKKPAESAIQASSLSAGFLFGDIGDGGRYRAENNADSVTDGAPQDTYTRVTPVFGAVNDVRSNSNVTESYYYYYGHNNEFSPLNKTPVQNVERNSSRYPSNDKFRRASCSFSSDQRSCWGRGQLVSIRSYSGNGTRSEPLYRTKTGYYDILEVSSSATQAQVKTAYYKQSFIFHPDRNAGGDEATVRFSEISEAYAVLGNKALRKKYDRGLLTQSDLVARPSGKDTAGSSGKQQGDRRRSVVGADTRGSVYDFDKFFKAHYSEQLQREKDLNLRREEMLKRKQETVADKKLERTMDVGILLMLVMAVALLFNLKSRS